MIDASVVVEFLSGAEHSELAAERLRADREELWAPHLLDAEAGHALRRLVGAGELGTGVGEAALEDLPALPVRRVSHAPLLRGAWRHQLNLSFYDALYVALAEELETRVITFDAHLARAAPSRKVELLRF